MIRFIEERSINALPALQTAIYDGWILRFANGYTRRANSINPLYPSSLPLDQKIDYCEQLYSAQGLAVVYKLTSAAVPSDLDARLDTRGYSMTESVIVQTCDLNAVELPSNPELQITSTVSDEWLADYCRLNETNPARIPTIRQMLASLLPTAAFASIRHDGAIVAVGLGVLEDDTLGLFDIVVDASVRRQGLGYALVGGLMDWGKDGGARTAYLQVVAENERAQRLYARLGFREHHRYWYRTLVRNTVVMPSM